MRKVFIAGNWKMNLNKAAAVELVNGLRRELKNVSTVDIGVCPPFVYLQNVIQLAKESNIKVGAQNMHYEEKGAFTGEVAVSMLKDIECEYVILGHSERRHIFDEDDALINKKVKSACEHGLKPILCVGELLEEREAGDTEKVVETQIREGLKDISADAMASIVIAYEPVWAIGTGKTATPDQANDVHKFIRGILKEMFDEKTAQNTIIQYGGSVKPENVFELLSQSDLDGALVGGASLKLDSFVEIVKQSVKITEG